jgi:hypothetical protein
MVRSFESKRVAAMFFARFPDGFGVMQPMGDNYAGTNRICGSPWMGRAFLDRAFDGRGPFCPDYWHFFADEELYEASKMHGILFENYDVSQYHDHWQRNGAPRPDYLTRARVNWERDKELFHRRRETRFADFLGKQRLDADSQKGL